MAGEYDSANQKPCNSLKFIFKSERIQVGTLTNTLNSSKPRISAGAQHPKKRSNKSRDQRRLLLRMEKTGLEKDGQCWNEMAFRTSERLSSRLSIEVG